jgi:hypothetical protein
MEVIVCIKFEHWKWMCNAWNHIEMISFICQTIRMCELRYIGSFITALFLTYIFFIYSYTTVSWLYRLFSNIYRSRSRRWYYISLCYYIPSYIEVFFDSHYHFHILNSFQLLKLRPILKYDVLYSPFGMLCVIIYSDMTFFVVYMSNMAGVL